MKKDIFFKITCISYSLLRLIFRRSQRSKFRMVSHPFPSKDKFPIENIVESNSHDELPDSFSKKWQKVSFGVNVDLCMQAWDEFIKSSVISDGYKYSGIHYGGYILEYGSWCLPSWIWTNGAIVRYFIHTGQILKAENLVMKILYEQQSDGGWIVRNDYSVDGELQVIAPNDSAYLANNAILSLYGVTKNPIYLESAIKCAEWIIDSARSDGMVYVGYYANKRYWNKKNNIVDVGFTAAFFAKLYMFTKDVRYKEFLSKFVNTYIQLFYIKEKNWFAASTINDKPSGKAFARGQAWALEGLIPAYKILQEDYIKTVISEDVTTLLKMQNNNGSWAFILDRPYLGEDCKGTPVIAKALMEWYMITGNSDARQSARKALDWCIKHTSAQNDDSSYGGIFSYNAEGAIVHSHNTECAVVYASVYAAELKYMLENG